MDAVKVVEAQVGTELAFEAAQARLHVASEGRAPGLVEDRLVRRLDVAVSLRAPGVGCGWRAPRFSLVAELALELVAVVGEKALETPAGGLQVGGRTLKSVEAGLPLLATTSSAHPNEKAASIAVSCQTLPSVPRSRPA